jgi:hypothetical protein
MREAVRKSQSILVNGSSCYQTMKMWPISEVVSSGGTGFWPEGLKACQHGGYDFLIRT